MARYLSMILILVGAILARGADAPAPALLHGFPQMEALKRAVASGDPAIAAAYDKLLRDTRIELTQPPLAVTDKGANDALGLIRDPHDYVSVATYYWPVPGDPTAPWVGTDGKPNTALVNTYDTPRLHRMADRMANLTLAWWLSGDRAFADAAITQLRTWFIAPATAMTPNLAYSQIKVNSDGNQGTQTGVIDGEQMVNVLSAVALLDRGGVLTAADRKALRTWFSKFLDWYLTDPRALRESQATNNHGLFYDLQVMSFALFTGRQAVAQGIYDNFAAKRIATQIEPDGTMPKELGRVDSGTYTCFALDALMDVLSVARNSGLGSDLWTWTSTDGRSWRKAMEFLKPYISGTPWPYGTRGFNPERGVRLYRRAASTLLGTDDLTWAGKVALPTIDRDLLWNYLPITAAAVSAFTSRLYTVGLGRIPDPLGLAGWSRSLLEGTLDGAEAARGVLLSPEFAARNLADGEFVDTLYRVFLDRAADAAGRASWLAQLTAGGPREDLIDGFLLAPEFATRCTAAKITAVDAASLRRIQVRQFVRRFYLQCLGREPDTAGAATWSNGLLDGTVTGTAIARGFVLSPEFTARKLGHSPFLDVLYRALFDRAPDAAGQTAWRAKLVAGTPRSDVLDGFLGSVEFRALCDRYRIIAAATGG